MPVYKDKERGTWYASFYYKDFTGKNRKKKKEGFAKKGEAQEYEREFKAGRGRKADMKFETLVDLYFTDKAARLRLDTIENKRNMVSAHIVPYFGERVVDEITASDVREWQNVMLEKKKSDGTPYAPTYLRSISSQLSTIFNFAVTFHNLRINPCRAAGSMGKRKADKMDFWTKDEFDTVLPFITDPAYHLFANILFWTGCREGEGLALRPCDVLPTPAYSITKTHKRRKGEDKREPTKTERSVRSVTIPQFLYEETTAYCSMLYGLQPKDRIFHFTKSAFGQVLDAAAAKAGMRRIRVHDLRHSHAALLVDMGYSILVVAERLGDTEQVAMETYGHLYPDKQKMVAAELDAMAEGRFRKNSEFTEK